MNLVTAVIVEGSFQQASTDREVFKEHRMQKIKNMMPTIRSLFEILDDDGSGVVTLGEIQGAPMSIQIELSKIIEMDNLEEIFHMLDEDGGGEVSIDEFCE